MPKQVGYPHNQMGWIAVAGVPTENPDTRGVGWGIEEHGWQQFIEQRLVPYVPSPFLRIAVSNPFGRTIVDTPDGYDTRWPMDFDQFLLAQDDGLALGDMDAFVDAWSKFKAEHLDPVGGELIFYLGSITASPGMTAIDDDEVWYQRAWRAIEPMWRVGASIAFDRGVFLEEGTRPWDFYTSLQRYGVTTYIEPHPPASKQHLLDENVMVVERHWQSANKDRDAINGEVVRILRDADDRFGVVDDGHTFALGASEWQEMMKGGR